MTEQRMPWEKPLPKPLEDRFEDLLRDVAIMVSHTCVLVRSSNARLNSMRMNVPRDDTVPKSSSSFRDGTTLELINIGMPQHGVQFGTVAELLKMVYETAADEGLQL